MGLRSRGRLYEGISDAYWGLTPTKFQLFQPISTAVPTRSVGLAPPFCVIIIEKALQHILSNTPALCLQIILHNQEFDARVIVTGEKGNEAL